MSKKWLSLDDLKNASKRDNYINLSDVKNKKNSPKNLSVKSKISNNRKDKWESTQVNNNVKNLQSAKPQVTKKHEKGHVKISTGSREKENMFASKFDNLRNKPVEEKRGLLN